MNETIHEAKNGIGVGAVFCYMSRKSWLRGAARRGNDLC